MDEDWVTRLRSQYSRMGDLARRIDIILAGDRPDDPTDFWRLRWAMMSLTLANLRTKRDAMTALLGDDRNDRHRGMTDRWEDQQVALVTAYLDYSQRWAEEPQMADWGRYTIEARRMLGNMRARILQMETELLPLLADAQARRAARASSPE